MRKVIAILNLFTVIVFGQAPDTLWTKTFGGADREVGYAVVQTVDEGFILTGLGGDDLLVVKTDLDGSEMWSRTYSGGNGLASYGKSIGLASDGGYIITGSTWISDDSVWNSWLLKIDPDGNEEWSRIFGGTDFEYGRSVQQTSDGGFIIAGQKNAGANSKMWLIKTDSVGIEEWNRTFAGQGVAQGYAGQQTSDGGFIIVGSTSPDGQLENSDVFLVKTDNNGADVWSQTFSRAGPQQGLSIQQTLEGGFIITGYSRPFVDDAADMLLLKTDSEGSEVWNATFGGLFEDSGNSVQQTNDGGYIIAGVNRTIEPAGDLWIVKANQSGTLQWEQILGGSAFDGGWSVKQTSNGGFIIIGETSSYGAGSDDVWLIRLAPDPPAASANLIATPGDQQITLTWDANIEADLAKYRIYRDTSSPASTLVDSVVGTPPDTFYNDAGLINGQEYFYRITAVDSAGNESAHSDEVSATPALFTDIAAGLTDVSMSSVAWGDYDNDGDLDILLIGFVDTYVQIAKIYRNNEGTYTDIGAELTGVRSGSVAWGDYDNDGDLDVLLTGQIDEPGSIYTKIAKVYRNDEGTFTAIGAELPGVASSSTAWGDYDNDGDLDALLTGQYGTGPGIVEVAEIYRNDAGIFSTVDAGLSGTHGGSAEWGDYDNDGDLDILLTGTIGGSKIYRNDRGTFTDIGASLVGSSTSGVWGDFDNDGDLDALITGYDGSQVTNVYKNDVGTFTDINADLDGVSNGSAAWGDYDNDGDLDILLVGRNNSLALIAKIYRNDSGTFSDIGAMLTGVQIGSGAWGDYDNDRDLDVIITGSSDSGWITKIYQNNINASNEPPIIPTGLGSSIAADSVTLTWAAASDNETTATGLTYNLRIGTTSSGSEIMSPHADATTGYRYIPALGNVNHNTSWALRGLNDGTYYYSVQAVDAGFLGSQFASEQSFTIAVPPAAPTNLATTSGNEQVTLTWSANTEADLAKYHIYRDTASPASTLIDSVVSSPPDTSYTDTGLVVGQLYYYRATAIDTSGNESEFSAEVTGIPVDLEPPTILSISSVSGFLIPEYDTLTISCTINDNDFVDSAWAIFDNSFGVRNGFIGQYSNETYTGVITVPAGITVSAVAVVYAKDRSDNVDSLQSQFFTVLDNTPPTVVWKSLEVDLPIALLVPLGWTAYDNVGVVACDLAYKVSGETWITIEENITDTTCTWIIPNEPTDNLTLRLIARDAVGLSDTAYSVGHQIIITYPTLLSAPDPDVPWRWFGAGLHFTFSQLMDTASVTDSSVSVQALYTPSPQYDIIKSEGLTDFELLFTRPLASHDSLTIMLHADRISNYYGYPLDGNANGIPEGSPTDDITYTYTVLPYADFDSSLTIDFDDLTRFVTAWYTKDYSHELGPSSGTMPHLLMEPDGDFNGRDLITFIRMWDWYSQYASPLARIIADRPIISPEVSYENGRLLIHPEKLENLAALHLRITYPSDKVHLNPELSDSSRFGLQLERNWAAAGVTEIDLAMPIEPSNTIEVQVNMEIIGREPVDIGVYIEAVDKDGSVIGQGETTIEVLPIPTEFALHQNYPNPFNPNTTIMYDLPKAGDVTLIVYDLLGREVVRLVDSYLEAGYLQVIWDGRDRLGREVPSGIYIARLVTPAYTKSIKMLLLK